jgi:hypothetical protein
MIAMTTSSSTNVKASLKKCFSAGHPILQVVIRKPVVENFRGIGFAPTLYPFRFL